MLWLFPFGKLVYCSVYVCIFMYVSTEFSKKFKKKMKKKVGIYHWPRLNFLDLSDEETSKQVSLVSRFYVCYDQCVQDLSNAFHW